jgi:hypothetical protein
MAPQKYPVLFEPHAFESLTNLAGDKLSEIETAIQALLSRRPREGVPFPNGLRAYLMTPPGKRIIVVYQFDGESVFVTKILG